MTVVSVEDGADAKNPKFAFANRTRYVILVLATLCLSIILSNTLTLNFTIICMAPKRNDSAIVANASELVARAKRESTALDLNSLILQRQKVLLENQERQDVILKEIQLMLKAQSPRETFMNVIAATSNLEEEIILGTYDYTQSQKSQLFSIVAIGALVAVYPTIWLIQYFGPRKVVSAYGFVSALSTALIPLFASWGFWWLLFMRFIQGTALSVCLNVIGYVTAHWSMLKTNAFFIALLTCFFQFGPIFTMPISGMLCESSLGWPSVYYLHAVITVILFILFAYFYRDAPHQHRNVSTRELGKIQRGKEDMPEKEPVPYRAILSSNAIWAVWISALANFMGIQITMQYSPTYLNKVMGFPVEMTGLFSAIPQIFTFLVKIMAGILSDKLTCIRPVVSVKLFNTIALAGMGTFMFAMAYTPSTEPMLGLVLLSFCCTILGFNCGAFFKSSQLVARHHNHFIMGNNSFINCLATLLAPVIVSIFVKDDTIDEWWWVWMLHGCLLYVCNLYFCIFGRADPAEWTKTKPKPSPNQVAAA